jgi:nucleoside-diphosphate-sugar epimerase
MNKKVLVTGSDGYIGTVLASTLIEKGYDVVGVDCGFYRSGWFFSDQRPRPITLSNDIRKIGAKDVEGFDAVVHLAELSNDPLAEHDPAITYDINHSGSVNLATACKAAGVPRFIYASSCSVYGAAADGSARDERSETHALTAYAKCKLMVERDVGAMADKSFSPVFLRNATAFGASPRMRFDIVLNNLAGFAWTTKEIKMTSDGTPWRPLVHIEDISQAIVLALKAPREQVHNQIFNVGDDTQNYRVSEIAQTVGKVFEGCSVSFGTHGGDNRSYRISFQKIRQHLPDFRCKWNVEQGARELLAVFDRVAMTEQMFQFRAFTRLKQLKHLLDTQQIDKNFYWRAMNAHSDFDQSAKFARQP